MSGLHSTRSSSAYASTSTRPRVSSAGDAHYLKPFKRNIVDIFVTRDVVERALDTASDLFLALEDRGHRVVFAPGDTSYARFRPHYRHGEKEDDRHDGEWGGPARPTLLFMGSVAVGLTLFEVSEEVESGKWVPSGRLGLHAYSPDQLVHWEEYWLEQAAGDLRNSFDAIAIKLEGAVPYIVRRMAETDRAAKELQKKREAEALDRERDATERREVEEEKEDLKELIGQVESWRFAPDLRALVAELKDILARRGLRISVGGPVEEWVNWVMKKAEEADPHAMLRRDADAMAKEFGTSPRYVYPLGSMLSVRRRRSRR